LPPSEPNPTIESRGSVVTRGARSDSHEGGGALHDVTKADLGICAEAGDPHLAWFRTTLKRAILMAARAILFHSATFLVLVDDSTLYASHVFNSGGTMLLERPR
jgi:hypothetical protein